MPITVASQKLKAKPGSQDEKSEAIGASRALVRFWMDGSRRPSPEWIERVWLVYDIHPNEWDVEPLNAPPPKARPPKPERAEAAPPPVVAQIDPSDIIGGGREQLRRIAEMRQTIDDPRLAVRLEETERACRHTLAIYLGEGRTVTESVLLRSPAFARVTDKIRSVLRNYPDALLALTEALESIGD